MVTFMTQFLAISSLLVALIIVTDCFIQHKMRQQYKKDCECLSHKCKSIVSSKFTKPSFDQEIKEAIDTEIKKINVGSWYRSG